MKLICKVGSRLILLLSPFFVFCPVAVGLFPMHFLDGEYSIYCQNQDWCMEHESYYRVLIMGDSTAKAACLPAGLSGDTYNFSLPGVSPIEEYYYLRDYLTQNTPPQYIIYMQSPSFFTDAQGFWNRNVYFHRLGKRNIAEIVETQKDFQDVSVFGTNDVRTEAFLYATFSPAKYSVAFFSGLLSPGRYRQNMKRYQSVQQAKGQMQFGVAEYCDKANNWVEYSSFSPNEVIDVYFRKLIKLCIKNGIHFIYMNPPMNEATYSGLQEQFVIDFTSYLVSIGKDYPEATIDERIYSYDNSYFGDRFHLNMRGTRYFTNNLKKNYEDIFPGQ